MDIKKYIIGLIENVLKIYVGEQLLEMKAEVGTVGTRMRLNRVS